MTSYRRKEIHPLFNPTVLNRIFESLKVHTLKRTRLVCKSWNAIASSHLQRNSKVVLLRGKETDKKHLSYKNFLEYIESLPSSSSSSSQDAGSIFFRNYHIEHWILNFRREKSLHKFWSLCGPTMKELHLKDIIFYEVETIGSVFFSCTPNLESLTLEDCLFYTITQENLPAVYQGTSSHPPQADSDSDDDETYIFFDYYDHVSVEQLKKIDSSSSCVTLDSPIMMTNKKLRKFRYEQLGGEEFPLSWREVFQAYPNMKECSIAASTPTAVISELLSVVSFDGVKSSLSKLNGLSFYPSPIKEGSFLTNDHLESLLTISFNQLSHLELHIGDDNSLNLGYVIMLLNKMWKSLRSLSLSRISCDSIPYQDVLPLDSLTVMGSLKKLQVSLNLVGSLSSESLLHNLKKFPHIKELVLWDRFGCYNWEVPVDAMGNAMGGGKFGEGRCLKVESFSCGYRIKSAKCVEYLCQTMKCLRVLEAALNDEQIRIVFRDLKELEELTILDRYLTDSGVTGNPILLSENTEWCPEVQREFPYIGDMKKLQRFILKYWKYDGITDLSVYHGFLDVANLSHLHLTNTKISNGALDKLVYKSSLISLLKTVDINSESVIAIKGDA